MFWYPWAEAGAGRAGSPADAAPGGELPSFIPCSLSREKQARRLPNSLHLRLLPYFKLRHENVEDFPSLSRALCCRTLERPQDVLTPSAHLFGHAVFSMVFPSVFLFRSRVFAPTCLHQRSFTSLARLSWPPCGTHSCKSEKVLSAQTLYFHLGEVTFIE